MFDSALPAMPEPHPVDYEWRYTAATADSLANYLTQTGQRIGCFGTPTVFWRLRQMGADATLFDRNDGLLQYLRIEDRPHVRIQDLLRSNSNLHRSPDTEDPLFDVLLLDPPWYVDHVLTWITRAIQFLRPGGSLVFTLFPDLIRPAAFNERKQVVATLESLGPLSFLPFPALYTTPLFEHETLSAFGLADLGQWRSADFVSVKVAGRSFQLRQGALEEHGWSKVQLGTQVIAVRGDLADAAEDELCFRPPESDGSYLLKSVSARDPARKNVSVWTSRNRALVVKQGGSSVLPFLTALAAGITPAAALAKAPTRDRPALELLLALTGW